MLKIVDRGGVCSTLSFVGVAIEDDEEIKKYHGGVEKYIVLNLKNQIQTAPDNTEIVWTYSPSNSFRTERKTLDGFPVDAFAIFYTTILCDQIYEKARSVLKGLGFKIDEEEKIYNSKNRTHVYPVYGNVKTILKNLEKYDDRGNLISEVKKSQDAAEKRKKIPANESSRLSRLRRVA